jgi:hypothetical protein
MLSADSQTKQLPRTYLNFLKFIALQILVFYLLVVVAGSAWSQSMSPKEFAGMGLVVSVLLAHFLLVFLIPIYFFIDLKGMPFIYGVLASFFSICLAALFLYIFT